MRSDSPEGMQTCYQARPELEAHRGVRRRAEGGLPQDQDQPSQGCQARLEEVVLHSIQGVRTLPMKPERLTAKARLASFTSAKNVTFCNIERSSLASIISQLQ